MEARFWPATAFDRLMIHPLLFRSSQRNRNFHPQLNLSGRSLLVSRAMLSGNLPINLCAFSISASGGMIKQKTSLCQSWERRFRHAPGSQKVPEFASRRAMLTKVDTIGADRQIFNPLLWPGTLFPRRSGQNLVHAPPSWTLHRLPTPVFLFRVELNLALLGQ
jgi:hypothetical protein